MSLHIRALRAEDFEEGFLETLGSLAPVDLTMAEAMAIWRQRSASGIHTVVTEIDGRVVGTASLIVEKKYIHRGGLVGHIEDVAVHSDHWRKGIGTAMVEQLARLASTLRCYKVILNCHDHLVPFYHRIGFKRHDSGLRCDLPLSEFASPDRLNGMKIGVISDTHDRAERTAEAIRLLIEQGAELLIHGGDIVSPATVRLFASVPTHFVFGNNDDPSELADAIADIGARHHDESGQLMIAGMQIAWTHGHRWHLLRDLERSNQFNYLFYGHTHVAEAHRTGKTLVANPGALHRANPKTCLLVDLANGELRTIEIP